MNYKYEWHRVKALTTEIKYKDVPLTESLFGTYGGYTEITYTKTYAPKPHNPIRFSISCVIRKKGYTRTAKLYYSYWVDDAYYEANDEKHHGCGFIRSEYDYDGAFHYFGYTRESHSGEIGITEKLESAFDVAWAMDLAAEWVKGKVEAEYSRAVLEQYMGFRNK